ncbi:archaeosortase/exosortase family protein [Synechocystis sp. CACIAM 05]|uniref:archaeosortase/exosortase family protein n=1 Tax=Synechocystis sp. CACIAM 05 TaxID=1933929 RepID=UPI00139099AD|nr:archaeosortase/exosortase family protein [Synechocystis sp. CACIAM 05]
MVLQALSLSRQGVDYTKILINLIFFASAFYYYYQRRHQLKFPAQTVPQIVAVVLLSLVIFKLPTLRVGEAGGFWIFASPITFLSIVLLASGFYGLKQFWRFWSVFIFLWATFWRTPWLGDSSSWLTVFSAKVSSYFLWYLGFNPSTEGSLVYVNDGIIDIYNGCTLTPLLFISIDLLVILYAFYPMSRKRADIIFTFSLALLLSFALSIVRLAIMALVVNDTPKFDYWHGSPGSNLFMTICLVGCGLYAISRMPTKQSEKPSNSQPLPPLANPEWIVKGFLLALVAILSFLMLLPDGGAKRLANFQFPADLPLPGWQVVGSQPLSAKEMGFFLELAAEEQIADLPQQVEQEQREQRNKNILMSGRRYDLKQGDVAAQMTLTYVLNSDASFPSLGDSDFSKLADELMLEEADVNLPHLVIQDENKTHLVACLTAFGKSGANINAALYGFDKHRIRYMLTNPQAFYQWMTGQRLLSDRRCLWVHLSEESVDYPGTNQRLVGLWQDLQSYWAQAFPPL